ncbi:unnamed protein product, partial [Nesidiocoris tenuis]
QGCTRRDTVENTIPFEHWSRADSPAMETRRAAGTRAGRCRAGRCNPSSYQPPGTAQQAVGTTISRIYDPRALSCCGNILWFEKCNTSEYAAGGHRPTRSDAAKQIFGRAMIQRACGELPKKTAYFKFQEFQGVMSIRRLAREKRVRNFSQGDILLISVGGNPDIPVIPDSKEDVQQEVSLVSIKTSHKIQLAL